MSDSFIIAARRTPVGKFLGSLAGMSAPQLAARALAAALADARLPLGELDEVLLGEVLPAGVGQAPARQAALAAGVPASVGAATLNKVCGSGLYAVMLADRAIRGGDARAILAGGMESMSQAPHLLRGGRSGWKYGQQPLLDAIEHDGLRCAAGDTSMGCYADALAAKRGIARTDQDSFSLESHRRAIAAREQKQFAAEIVPLTFKAGKTTALVEHDENPRSDTSLERLAVLPPAFAADGTVTAGNSSPLSDGAAALVVVNGDLMKSLRPQWAFRIVAQAVSAGPPADLFTTPVPAIRLALKRAGWSVGEVDLWELNEAFASQTLACARELELPPERLNVRGGAIALGHPIGCSGARVLVTLLHALAQTNKARGVAALCLGGGEAVAVAVERV